MFQRSKNNLKKKKILKVSDFNYAVGNKLLPNIAFRLHFSWKSCIGL